MKAIAAPKYGPPDILRLMDVEKPAPGDHEVLVEVHASSVNFNTLGFVRGEPFVARLWSGLLRPKLRPGNDISGRVEEVGRNVKEFRPGDEVFGDLASCGFGAYAEYVVVPESGLALKPANLSFEEAAAVPEAALVALLGLRDKGRIGKGQTVLIYGASGGIGTFAVQIAKAFEAEVTGVCSTRTLARVRSIGADQVIDYSREDFARNGRQYDLILATAGYRSLFDYRRALSPGGSYVATGGAMAQIFQAMLLGPLLSMIGGKKLTNLYMAPSQKDLLLMKELIEAGKVKPVIDRCYTLRQAPEALKYYARGHARGKVVITIVQNIPALNY